MTTSTKIVRLEVEAFKRLRAVTVKPDGSLVVISGKNGAGKSSTLDAIEVALAGLRSAPERPVRAGEERARIVCELEDIVVTRTFTAAGGSALTVTSKDGARYPSPQAMLDKLVGKISLDPLAFARKESKDQLSILRDVVGLDTTAIEERRRAAFEKRTLANREAHALRGQLSGLDPAADAPDAPVSIAALAEALKAAGEVHRAAQDRQQVIANREAHALQLERDRERGLQDAAEFRRQAAALIVRAERVEADMAEFQAKSDEYRAVTATMKDEHRAASEALPDLDAASEALAAAEGTNARVRRKQAHAKISAQLAAKEADADALTAEIEAADRAKREAIAAAKMPIDGLGIDENGVLLNGQPFAQASHAEKLRASVAIAIAMNPKLKVLLIRDGSLLDDEGLALVAKMAEDAGAQVWLERVASGDEGVGIVIEDGAVRGAAAEPEAAE